jgi:hypothetical protein
VFSPVPVADPPKASSQSPSAAAARFARHLRIASACAANSWPSVTGTASCRCVRPLLITSPNSRPLAASASTRAATAASTCSCSVRQQTPMAVGKVSLVDWLMFTWSLGLTVL